jgi:beta-phosphoglucomutase-like phosphatase (HAD superfamily)
VVEDSSAGIAAGLTAGARVASVRSGLRVDHPGFAGSFRDLQTLAAVLDGGWH